MRRFFFFIHSFLLKGKHSFFSINPHFEACYYKYREPDEYMYVKENPLKVFQLKVEEVVE